MARRRLLVPLLVLGLPALAGGCADPGGGASGPVSSGPVSPAPQPVRRGASPPRLLLTGELAAARALELKAPSTRTRELQVRWMERDGTPVRAGQPVVELDNSSFTSELQEKRLKASEAADELERKKAEIEAGRAEKAFEVAKSRGEVEKARRKADLPPDLFAAREIQERRLDVERAEAALAKAESALEAHIQESAVELRLLAIELEKARRAIGRAEASIRALSLSAPEDGILLISQHPWQGRKLQEGDTVWAGMTLATLPDLSSLVVEAALSDVDDGRIAPGMPALCVVDAYPSETFGCRVTAIAPVARERASGSLRRFFPVRVGLERIDPRLRPGLSVRVEVPAPPTPPTPPIEDIEEAGGS